MKIIRIFLGVLLVLGTLVLLAITAGRLRLDYNEGGVYFDPEAGVTYHSQAIIAYGGGALLLAVLFIIVIRVWR